MSKEDIYAGEVVRRRKSIDDVTNGLIDIGAALEQFNDLDETYKSEQKIFEDRLNCIYLETRHYNGNWPIVYNFVKSDKHPYFNGDSDDDCNPYYRISRVIAGLDEGLSPYNSEPTRTGGPNVNRYRAYANENTLRSTALSVLQAYPNTIYEGGGVTGGSCSDPQYTTQSVCLLEDEIWTPAYESNTAVDLLLNALNPWKTALTQLKADLCGSELDKTVADALIQDIIDQINVVISELPPAPVYPNITPSATVALQNAINATIAYIQTDMPADIDSRKTSLNSKSELLEKKFYGIIGLRLHQINGSYSKVQSLKDQRKTNLGLIKDHKKSITDINILRVKES